MEMLCDWLCSFVAASNGGSVEEDTRVLVPVLIFRWEITVVYMACYRSDFKVSSMPFEMTLEGVDWDSSCWTRSLFEVFSAEGFCDRLSDGGLLSNHHHSAWAFD